MRIDDELLNKLQKLGMIKIQEDKREEIKEQISEVLGFVENLSSIQTEHINIQDDLRISMREDIPEIFLGRDDVLRYAPDSRDGYFVVPKIIE